MGTDFSGWGLQSPAALKGQPRTLGWSVEQCWGCTLAEILVCGNSGKEKRSALQPELLLQHSHKAKLFCLKWLTFSLFKLEIKSILTCLPYFRLA